MGYFAIAKLILTTTQKYRFELIAIVSIVGVAMLFDWGDYKLKLVAYIAFFMAHYFVTFTGAGTRFRYLFGILFPIGLLVLFKYLPDNIYLSLNLTLTLGGAPTAIGFVGLSYMAFRTSYLTAEIYNTSMPRPTLAQYFCYAFFLPTFAIGPISRFQSYMSSLNSPDVSDWRPYGNSVERILKGAVKYFFLAPIFAQLDYNGLLLDGNLHHPIDLAVASVAFYGFIYCNFSGFCDMIIGGAGILRVRIDENFNKPYFARNVQDFWNRWHMTLNAYMRDMVFTNLSKSLLTRFGVKHINICLTISIITVFLLIGIWHGRAWNFVIFGLLHGGAVVVTHWYGVILKSTLSRDQYRAYHANTAIKMMAILLTFVYLSGTFMVFANDIESLTRIFQVIQWP